MLDATPIRAESPRYGTSLLLLPELWAPGRLWLPVASFLGHRGWEGQMLELRGSGDLRERVAAVLEHARALPARPMLIGHGAGAIVALEVARAGAARAAVLLAPLLAGSAPLRALMRRRDAIAAVLLGRPIPPPRGAAFGDPPTTAASELAPDTARAVLDLVRGRPPASGAIGAPVLVVGGDRDPLLPPDAAAALAGRVGGEHLVIPGAAHWPLVESRWQHTVGLVHRWLVRQLGEELLDLHGEAMAERDAEPDES